MKRPAPLSLLFFFSAAAADPEAAERFLEKTRGNIRSRIKKYQAREEESVQDLLVKWISSPADCWYKMLHSEGIPTMMEIKNPK